MNRTYAAVLTVVLSLIFCSVLLGEDVIKLNNGRQLRGEILEEDEDFVRIKNKYGIIQEISREEIDSIKRGFDFGAEFAQRASRLDQGNAEGWYKLGLWCEENKKPDKAKECFRKAIEAESNHPAAREKLGHRKWKGKWYESDQEYYKARDWVNYGGEWMPRDDMDKYKAGLVKRDDGTWISKKVWDEEDRKRRIQRRKKKEEKKKARKARGEKVEETPEEDESGDAAAAIRRRMAQRGSKKNPLPKDKAQRKKWIQSFKQKRGWKNHFESKHYVFVSNAPPDKTKYYAQVMDRMYAEYCRIFVYKQKQEKPFLVALYGNQREFMSKERRGGGVRGYYDGAKIVAFQSGSCQGVLFHEGTHQFQGLIWPGMNDFRLTRVAGGIWMVEGLATYFECAQIVKGGKIATGQVNKRRLGTLRSAMARNRYTKLPKLIRMVQRGYSAFHYAHGWGLTYFLIHASSKTRDKFKKYFKEFRKPGVDPVASFKKMFPWDEEKLDQQWRSYILNLR